MNRPSTIPTFSKTAIAQAAIGLLLCGLGFYLTRVESYEVHTVLASAGGCNLPTDIYEPRSGSPIGSMVLFHGIAANKKVMGFTAQEFANQDLRVFATDLPGHGKAPGPFTPDRAESCAVALVRDLAARHAIIPERTFLAGHSMGGAIALRVAAQFPVAGVIAISPAPMEGGPDVSPELLLFPTPPPLAPHSLVLSAQWEPPAIQRAAETLVVRSANPGSKYFLVPRTTHVSILFAQSAFELMRSWTAQVLGVNPAAPFPLNRPGLGCILGLVGLSLLTPPFLREMASVPSANSASSAEPSRSFPRSVLLLAIAATLSALLLHFFIPFRFVSIFQGDYLASFLFLTGTIVLLWHRAALPSFHSFLRFPAGTAAASAVILILLFGAWFELTFYEAWLAPARWVRVPVLFLAFLPWHLAEELLLGTPARSPSLRRLVRAQLFRAILWLVMVAAIFAIHSGQFLYVLMAPYFATFSVLQRLAIDAMRARTQSPSAAAIFGAILLAAFVLAILPIA